MASKCLSFVLVCLLISIFFVSSGRYLGLQFVCKQLKFSLEDAAPSATKDIAYLSESLENISQDYFESNSMEVYMKPNGEEERIINLANKVKTNKEGVIGGKFTCDHNGCYKKKLRSNESSL